MVELLGVVGSPSTPSKTATAVDLVLDAAEDEYGLDTERVHLGNYDLVTADGRTLDAYEGDTADVLDQIVESEAFVFGTPAYRASYSGLLKNLFDMIPRGQWQADVAPLENTAVGLVATGATNHHYLVIDTELRPLMAFFGAYVAGGAYLESDQFVDKDEGYDISDEDIRSRLHTLGQATAELTQVIPECEGLSSLGPQI